MNGDIYLEDEIRIGNLIKKIPQYQYYFAPILETCMTDILNIPKSEIIKCPVMVKYVKTLYGGYSNESIIERNLLKVTANFTSNTMKYVGDVSVEKYLLDIMKNDEILGVMRTFETYTHLLRGMINMQNLTSSIIHMDLKTNNIMMDEIHDVPIIIDFGFAVTNMELLNMVDYAKSLNYYYWSYQYDADKSFDINWPIEVDLLCYISQIEFQLKNIKINDVIHTKDIANLHNAVDNYIEKTFMKYKYILSDENISYFSLHTKLYLSAFEYMDWKVLIDDLLRTYNSWDNFGLALIYNYFINHEATKYNSYCLDPFIQSCKKELVNVIISPPGKRSQPKDTLNLLLDNWGKKLIKKDIIN